MADSFRNPTPPKRPRFDRREQSVGSALPEIGAVMKALLFLHEPSNLRVFLSQIVSNGSEPLAISIILLA
jgi:hypothetical protein